MGLGQLSSMSSLSSISLILLLGIAFVIYLYFYSKNKTIKNKSNDSTYPNAIFDRLIDSNVKIFSKNTNMCLNYTVDDDDQFVISSKCNSANKFTIKKMSDESYNLISNNGNCITKISNFGYLKLNKCNNYDSEQSNLWKIKKNNDSGIFIQNVNSTDSTTSNATIKPDICISDGGGMENGKWMTNECDDDNSNLNLGIEEPGLF